MDAPFAGKLFKPSAIRNRKAATRQQHAYHGHCGS